MRTGLLLPIQSEPFGGLETISHILVSLPVLSNLVNTCPKYLLNQSYLLHGISMCCLKSGGDQHEGREPLSLGYRCYVDGSWKLQWNGGIGLIFFRDRELLAYKSARVSVCCPLQAEAIALREALIFANEMGINECTFYTDNKSLVIWVTQQQPPVEADWRAYKECYDIWRMLKESQDFKCVFIFRGHNGVADSLARRGREQGGIYVGHTFPMLRE